jgi:DUF971 family protein
MSHEGIRFVPKDQQVKEEAQTRTFSRAAITPAKVRVMISEGKGLEIDWSDGHKSAWSFAWLREACPCANCNEERKKDGRKLGQPKPLPVLPMYTPPRRPSGAHAVGRYAIQFDWLDGHTGGIYSWDYLRSICQCAECRFASGESTGTPN